MVPHVKVERFGDWQNDDKKFNIAFATLYGDIMKSFASGEAAEDPPDALFMDEQSLTPEIRTILACVAPKY
jgi:hypothetical protein